MIEGILTGLGLSGAAAIVVELVIIAGAVFGIQNHFNKEKK